MAAARELLIKKNNIVLAGVSQKSISIAGEPQEITDDQDNGWRTYDTFASVRSVDIGIEGSVKDAVLRALMLAPTAALLLTDITVEYPNGDTLNGDFYLNGFEESGGQDSILEFSSTLQSSGTITYTAA